MDAKTNRRANVLRIIEDKYDQVLADFARAIDRQPAQVWQFLNNRPIGEKLARDIEIKLGLSAGALDSETLTVQPVDGSSVVFAGASPNWKFVMSHVAKMPHAEQDKIAERVLAALTEKPWAKIQQTETPTLHQPQRRYKESAHAGGRGKSNKKFR